MQTTAATRSVVALAAFLSASLGAQERTANGAADQILAQEGYVRPPTEIERLVTAPRHLNVSLSNQSPTRRHFLKSQSDGMPTVAQFGKPWHNLAGLQIDPRANRARTLTTRASTGLEIIDAMSGRSVKVEIPAGATVAGARWSPDGTQIAFLANFDDASHVYVADVASGKSRRVTATPVLATLVTEPQWTASGNQVVVVLLPDTRGAEPKAPVIATGPKVRMTKEGAKNRTRTYADLLEWPYERDLVEYYSIGQLAAIDVRSRAVRKIGAPAMIQRVDPSPSGTWFRVAVMQKPFSYLVPVSAFGSVDQIWDATGKPVAELARRALREGDSGDTDDAAAATRAATDTAKRNIEWMPTGDALSYLQMDAAPAQAQAAAADEGAQQRARARQAVPVERPVRRTQQEGSARQREPDQPGGLQC